jgi:hypothetical protein
MRRRCLFAVLCLFVAVIALYVPENMSASAICVSSLPSNIDAGMLQPIAVALLQQSPTFQKQCARVANTAVLRVSIRVVYATVSGRAQTTITRYEAGALRAEVLIRFGEDYYELLAHELEHVLEQVDGVVLHDEMLAQRAWLTDSGGFETKRAFDAGMQVRQECDGLTADAIQANRRRSPRTRRQRD